MPSDTSLSVDSRLQTRECWKPFLAALCFIQFYVGFVTCGRSLYDHWPSSGGPTKYFGLALLGLGQATLLLLIGRSLCRRHRLPLKTVIVLGLLAAGYMWKAAPDSWMFQGWAVRWPPALIWFHNNQAVFLWASLFAVAILPGVLPCGRKRVFPIWVQLAVCWVMWRLAFSGLLHLYPPFAFSIGYAWDGITATAGLIVVAAGLLLGRSFAAAAALVVGLLTAGTHITGAYVITKFVDAAIGALLASSPYPTVNPVPWPWILLNQHAFRAVAVEAIADAGPLVVIAYFARRYPLRPPPDDGSPFPRRYCGACGYNLHGIDDDRCPECGVKTGMESTEPRGAKATSHPVPVLVQSRGDANGDWRAFVAVLCFLESYDALGSWALGAWTNAPWDWVHGWWNIRGILFLGCGVWLLRRRRPRLALSVLLLAMAGDLADGGFYLLSLSDSSELFMTAFGIEFTSSEHPMFVSIFLYLQCFVDWSWMALILTLTWMTLHRTHGGGTWPWWLLAAIAWSCGVVCLDLSNDGWKLLVPEADRRAAVASVEAWSLVAAIGLLLARSRLVLVPIALILLANICQSVDALQAWWLSPPRYYNQADIEYNQLSALLLWPVAWIAPWLILAWYAWRHPLRLPSDDGSPFPRRYCGACGYNLHGIVGERCPECGAPIRGDSMPAPGPIHGERPAAERTD